MHTARPRFSCEVVCKQCLTLSFAAAVIISYVRNAAMSDIRTTARHMTQVSLWVRCLLHMHMSRYCFKSSCCCDFGLANPITCKNAHKYQAGNDAAQIGTFMHHQSSLKPVYLAFTGPDKDKSKDKDKPARAPAFATPASHSTILTAAPKPWSSAVEVSQSHGESAFAAKIFDVQAELSEEMPDSKVVLLP